MKNIPSDMKFEKKPEAKPLDPNGKILIPAMNSIGFRRQLAIEKGTYKNILLHVWGGLGDQICAEPTLRYAIETLSEEFEISLVALYADFFKHLKFNKVYNVSKKEIPKWEDYYVFNCHGTHGTMPWDFVCHIYTHCVDAPCLYAFRAMLPEKYREIQLEPDEKDFKRIEEILNISKVGNEKWIVVHPGKHWQSKTFPVWFWNTVLFCIRNAGIVPILIGGHQSAMNDAEMTRTTVEVDTTGCLDLRCKLHLMETVALLKWSDVILTNDSAPLHMAASTDAWIGFITMAKNPDYLIHTRNGEKGWRMKNFEKGGYWQVHGILSQTAITDIGEENMLKWLPDPQEFAKWGIEKL